MTLGSTNLCPLQPTDHHCTHTGLPTLEEKLAPTDLHTEASHKAKPLSPLVSRVGRGTQPADGMGMAINAPLQPPSPTSPVLTLCPLYRNQAQEADACRPREKHANCLLSDANHSNFLSPWDRGVQSSMLPPPAASSHSPPI